MYIEKNDFDNVLRLGMNQAIKRELAQVLDAFLEFHLDKKLSDGSKIMTGGTK